MIPSFDDYPFRMPAPAFYRHMMALALFVSRKAFLLLRDYLWW